MVCGPFLIPAFSEVFVKAQVLLAPIAKDDWPHFFAASGLAACFRDAGTAKSTGSIATFTSSFSIVVV
jgi:hypothetical protein